MSQIYQISLRGCSSVEVEVNDMLEIYAFDEDEDTTRIYLTQSQARELAIAILSKAKEVDS